MPENENFLFFLKYGFNIFYQNFQVEYIQIELSRNHEITLFLMVGQKSYRLFGNHTKENIVENFVFKQ